MKTTNHQNGSSNANEPEKIVWVNKIYFLLTIKRQFLKGNTDVFLWICFSPGILNELRTRIVIHCYHTGKHSGCVMFDCCSWFFRKHRTQGV